MTATQPLPPRRRRLDGHRAAAGPGQGPRQALPGPRRDPPTAGRPRPGRGRRQLRDPAWRNARPRRRVGLRQDHGRPVAPAPHRPDVGHDPVRRQGHHRDQGRRAEAVPAADADHLPGPVREPRPTHADQRQHRRGAQDPWDRDVRRAAQEGQPDHGHGRPAAVPRPALPARVQRRPAPAHRHRPGARARARPRGLRRARVGPRRVHPGPGPQPAQLAPARARTDLRVRRPQHGRRGAHQRPGRGDVPGPDRGARRPARAVPPPGAPVHRRPHVLDPGP